MRVPSRTTTTPSAASRRRVAAAQNRRPLAASRAAARDVRDERRLAAAADREVADADDGPRQAALPLAGGSRRTGGDTARRPRRSGAITMARPDEQRSALRDATPSVHQPERTHAAAGPAAARPGDHGQRLALRAAVGFDERPRRRAEPRAPHRIGQQRRAARARARAPIAPGSPRSLLEERARRSPRSSACAGRRRSALPNTAGSRMLWPPVVDEAAADEHRRGDLIELRQLADRVEHDDVGARLGVDRQLGAARDVPKPPRARQPLDLVEPLGLAAARRSAARSGTRALDALEGLEARLPPRPCSVLPAMMHRAVAARCGSSAARGSRPRPCAAGAGSSSESNFRLPVTTTRSGSAPSSTIRRADSSLCMQKRSTSASTRRKNGRTRR